MQFLHAGGYALDKCHPGLHNKQHFLIRGKAPLPHVMRGDTGNHITAGDQLASDQLFRDLVAFLLAGCSHIHHCQSRILQHGQSCCQVIQYFTHHRSNYHTHPTAINSSRDRKGKRWRWRRCKEISGVKHSSTWCMQQLLRQVGVTLVLQLKYAVQQYLFFILNMITSSPYVSPVLYLRDICVQQKLPAYPELIFSELVSVVQSSVPLTLVELSRYGAPAQILYRSSTCPMAGITPTISLRTLSLEKERPVQAQKLLPQSSYVTKAIRQQEMESRTTPPRKTRLMNLLYLKQSACRCMSRLSEGTPKFATYVLIQLVLRGKLSVEQQVSAVQARAESTSQIVDF